MNSTMSDIVEYSLSTYGVSILLTVGNKVVVVNPQLLKNVPLEDMADVLSNSTLTDNEIIEAMETLDNARNTKIPTTKEADKT